MFKDTSELAENKLLLLYILDKLPQPTSNSHITQVVLENELINYFSLQQYISELVDNGFILDFKEDNTHKLMLTESGQSTLEFFIGRIPQDKIQIIDTYILNNNPIESDNFEFIYNISDDKKNNTLTLEMKKSEYIIGSFTISINKDEDLKPICDNWEKNGLQVYNEILNIIKGI